MKKIWAWIVSLLARESRTIMVEQLKNGYYMAYLQGNKRISGFGRTFPEAIEALQLKHPGLFIGHQYPEAEKK